MSHMSGFGTCSSTAAGRDLRQVSAILFVFAASPPHTLLYFVSAAPRLPLNRSIRISSQDSGNQRCGRSGRGGAECPLPACHGLPRARRRQRWLLRGQPVPRQARAPRQRQGQSEQVQARRGGVRRECACMAELGWKFGLIVLNGTDTVFLCANMRYTR